MFPGPISREQIDEMRKQQIAQLRGALEMQTTAYDITRRKIEAMQDAKKAYWRMMTAKIATVRSEAPGDPKEGKEYIESLIECRRAESCLRTAEIEQVELHHAMEGRNLDVLKEQMEQLENPSQLIQPHLHMKPSGLLS